MKVDGVVLVEVMLAKSVTIFYLISYLNVDSVDCGPVFVVHEIAFNEVTLLRTDCLSQTTEFFKKKKSYILINICRHTIYRYLPLLTFLRPHLNAAPGAQPINRINFNICRLLS